MSNISCKECGSHRVAQNVRLVYFDSYNYFFKPSYPVSTEIPKEPASWYKRVTKKNLVRKSVYTNVCADCGNVDVRVSPQDAQEIWETYQKNKSL